VVSAGASHHPNIPTGTFTGYVANASQPSQYLSGVTVQAYPEQGGQFCPTYLCAPQTTGSNGEYNVTCPVGRTYITFSKSFWDENLTYSTCTINATVDLGTVYLLPDGVVTGTVLGDVTGNPGIPGVTVEGEARDYSVVAAPGVTTSANGAFKVALPPGVAGRIDFTSPGVGWQNNFTFLTVVSGQTVSIGAVHLEPNSLVEAKFFDVVTHAPIEGGYNAPNSLTVCSSVTNACGTQGPPGTSSNVVEAVGAPGYDYVQAEAVGYLLNDSPIGYVPGTSPGHPYCVPDDCKIYLTPLGAAKLTIDLSGTPSHTYLKGLVVVQSCGMDGYDVALPKLNPVTYTYNTSLSDCLTSGCVPPGTTYDAPAFPLRNDIQISPDTTGICGLAPMWPIPGDLPVWGNETAANVTPYAITNVGYLNLTPGSYVEGNVYQAGTSLGPSGGFAVQIQSRVSTVIATYPYEYGRSTDVCPKSGPTVFCAPAPPGPDQLVVSAAGMPSNETWLSVPWDCCGQQAGPLLLPQVTLPSIDSLNMTPQAGANGSVVIAGGSEPIPYASVTACPASPSSTLACGEGLVNPSGLFSMTAVPIGWDVLHASGSGYAPNSQWFYVGSGRVNLPPLPLTPLATLSGYVISSNGSAVIDASVAECTLAAGVSSQVCSTPLGSGLTTSDGYYQGLVPGGWLPGATYEVEASAPGFETDWTWVNASVNETTDVPTLVLAPVGAGGTPDHVGESAMGTNPAGTWVVGRLIDNATGRGVTTSQIAACAVSSGICTQFFDGTNTGGIFNGSLPTGIYNFTVGATGYEPATVLITVPSGVPTVDIGTVVLDPLPWVFGQVVLNPWATIAVKAPGSSSTTQLELAPPATVLACSIGCAQATPDATSGAFQTQTYPGLGDTVFINPSYAGSFTSAPGGFVPTTAIVNVTSPLTTLTFTPSMAIFVGVSGTVYNSASCDVGGNASRCTDPARWVTVTVATSGVNNGVASATANGGGGYTVFVPGGNDAGATRVTAGDINMYFVRTEVVQALLGTYPGSNLTWVADPIPLTQFGYGYATVVSSVTGLPVVGTGISSSFNDPLNGHSGSTQGKTNGAGFVNLTAPSGRSVQFTIGGSSDYNNTTFSAPIPIGNATDLNLNFSYSGGAIPLPPWGWVGSNYLNFSAPTGYLGTVVDPWNGLPLSGASVAVPSADPTIASGGSSQSTNTLGEFLSDAPIGPADSLVVTLPAYQPNDTHPLNVTPGVSRAFDQVHLVGDGVLASQVVAEPSGLPVPGATVTVCVGASGHQTCVNTVTNATGHYWVDAAPGKVQITVTATGYVSNYTQAASVRTDTWTGIPQFEVVQDGVVMGTVRGLPTGLPVAGAVVSACSPIGGTPTGPCSYSVTGLANGSFALDVAPSQYILATAATGFNTSYLPVSVQPGETVDLGIVLLTEYGILTGTVVSSATGDPVANATVGGCPIDVLLACDVPTVTDLFGAYHIASPPGVVNLVVSAAGYLDGYLRATAVSGATQSLPSIPIAPIAGQISVHLSGRVVASQNPDQPIAAATVGLWVGSALAASTVTSASGAFALTVPSGTYVIEASAPGFSSVQQTLDATESITGLLLAVAPFGWTVSGTVTDGLTGADLPLVALWSPTGLAGMTDSSGAFAVSLPNGTYNLTAVPGGSSAALYAHVSFEVQVAAAPVVRPVLLYPEAANLRGMVESALNQSGISGAQVTVVGTAVDHASLRVATTGAADGTFSVPVYLGTYSVSVSAAGYRSVTVNVTLGLSHPALTIELTPLGSTSSGPSATDWGYTFVGLAVVGATVLIVAYTSRRRKKGSP